MGDKETKRKDKLIKRQKKIQKKTAKKQQRKQLPLSKKLIRNLGLTIVAAAVVLFILASIGTVVHATGLVDETINTANEYSKYGLSNYQLDFYVDNSWGWLPWNWSDGLGKSVMYGLYAITNFIWTISLYLSNATGYLVQEAYGLDFISQTADSIGKNIQTIAGITSKGFSSSGFYVGFLLILILVLGIYVAYTGLIKRETTKAIRAVLNFVVVFILSASFIAYAPDYIGKINDFSKDVSNASLDVGTKMVLPDSNSQGKDSVDLIRDSLFSVQVKQPWLLLQYGTTDVDALGAERVENLLATSPDTNNGEDRETLVIDEIENQDNANLTITKTISRLGTVFFLFIFNIGISIFVFLLTGIMIFSQVLFIIFAMFLPVSFLLSMIPSFDGMGRKAIMKLFNVIMTRAGITLIISVAFSISTMLYSLSASSPFFMIMFLQIVTFAGIYFNLGNLMSMFALQSNDSQTMGRQIFRRPRVFMHQQARRFQRSMNKTFGKHASSTRQDSKVSTAQPTKVSHERQSASAKEKQPNTAKPTTPTKTTATEKRSLGKQLGEKAGTVMDTKNRMVDKAKEVKDQVKDTPANVKYAVHKGKRDLVRNVSDFTQSVTDTKEQKQQERTDNRNQKRANIAQKRLEMDKARQKSEPAEPIQNHSQLHAPIPKKQRSFEERKQPVKRTESKTPATSQPSMKKESASGVTNTKSPANQPRNHTRPPEAKTPPVKEQPSNNQKPATSQSQRPVTKESVKSTTKKSAKKTTRHKAPMKKTTGGHKK